MRLLTSFGLLGGVGAVERVAVRQHVERDRVRVHAGLDGVTAKHRLRLRPQLLDRLLPVPDTAW